MRLIDADKIDFNEVFIGASEFAKDLKEAAQMLMDNQPTVEAVPVVHGTWVNTDGYDEWECGNCGYLVCGFDDEPSKGEMKFCNVCGADMRTSAE